MDIIARNRSRESISRGREKKLGKKLKSEVSYSRKWYPVSANGASRAQLKYEGKTEYENQQQDSADAKPLIYE